MKKKGNGTAGIVVTSILLVLLIALETFICVWLFGANYSAFDALVKEEEPIPGLDDGISPQGLCPLAPAAQSADTTGGYTCAMSGYLKSGPSRIYLIGKGKAKYITLKLGGKDVTSHFGGVTCDGESLFVASGKELLRVSLGAAINAEDGGALEAEAAVTVADFRSIAFCYYDFTSELLFAGEFYRPGNYETDESHHLEKDGEMNFGLVYAYQKGETGYENTPVFAISVREQVQGFAVADDGTVVLSTSYGLPDSRIFFYKGALNEEPTGTFNNIPLYRLDKTNLTKEWKTPCMSEEIYLANGRLYLLYESRSVKYRNFVRRQIDHILSASLADLLK